MIEIILLVVGFVVIAKSANWFIEAAMQISRITGLSQVFIGLTIFAIGTSAPELAVNLTSVSKNLLELPLGNILGSNIANLLLVLGVAALIRTVPIKRDTLRIGFPLNLLAILLVAVLASGRAAFPLIINNLSRLDGLMLLGGLSAYIYYALTMAKRTRSKHGALNKKQLLFSILTFVVSLAGLIAGANWIVRGATFLSHVFNLSEHFIGLSIVALGTSLPELAATVAGLLKGRTELVIGNIVGSNLINIFLVLGLTALMHPLPIQISQFYDMAAVALSTILVWLLIMFRKPRALSRMGGIICILSYAAYIALRLTFQPI